MRNDFVLWLASWYPSLLDPLQGDFVQRHAQAVSAYHPVELWAFIEDPEGKITSNHLLEVKHNGRLTEYIVYYNTASAPPLVPYKIWRLQRLLRLSNQLITSHYEHKALPKLVHTHIIMNLGITEEVPFIYFQF